MWQEPERRRYLSNSWSVTCENILTSLFFFPLFPCRQWELARSRSGRVVGGWLLWLAEPQGNCDGRYRGAPLEGSATLQPHPAPYTHSPLFFFPEGFRDAPNNTSGFSLFSSNAKGDMAAMFTCCLGYCCGDGGSDHKPLKEMPTVQLDTHHMGTNN